MRKLESRLLPALGSILLLAILLVGCRTPSVSTTGSAPPTTSSPASGQPPPTASASATPTNIPGSTHQLTCALETAVRPVDTVTETLHCTVAHVPSSETTFALQYTVMNRIGHPQTIAQNCRGALADGNGSCSVTFSVMAPLGSAKGTVSGATEPNRYPLGPVVPTQAKDTPTGSPLPL